MKRPGPAAVSGSGLPGLLRRLCLAGGPGPGPRAGGRPPARRPTGRPTHPACTRPAPGRRAPTASPARARRRGRRPDPERGSGTVLALGAVGAFVAVLTAALLLGGVVAARHRAESAADLAALAGAVALQHGADPCAEAARLGSANGAMVRCRVDGADVLVEAGVPTPPAARALADRAVARSRAGPQR